MIAKRMAFYGQDYTSYHLYLSCRLCRGTHCQKAESEARCSVAAIERNVPRCKDESTKSAIQHAGHAGGECPVRSHVDGTPAQPASRRVHAHLRQSWLPGGGGPDAVFSAKRSSLSNWR